jgi:ribonuclease D
VSDLPENNFYIDTPEALHTLLSRLPTEGKVRCSVDTEADSLHSYREKLCLIQFSAEEYHAIIDPLTISAADLTPLLDFLDRAEVWMHGADFDMTMLRRTFDRMPPEIFDTQTAARLTGTRQFGLANLVEEVFGVVLSKQSQRANWGRRPLLDKMIDYALNDVRYIIPLADHYMAKLKETGRVAWFHESCANARQNVVDRAPPDLENQWRINGSGKLKPSGMNFLRALWHWRDKEAERLDRPSFKVIGNVELIQFSEALQAGQPVELPARFPISATRRFHKSIRDAMETPQEQWPKRKFGLRMDRTAEADKLFEELKQKRDKVATELNLDPSLIASRAGLELISLKPELASEQLLQWQRSLLGV